MLEERKITECLKAISRYSDEELLEYSFLIKNETEITENAIRESGYTDEAKAVLYAAARINYKIALIRQSTNRITSFAAGDVRITESDDELKNARALLDEISADCAVLAKQNGFAFKAV